MFWSAIVIFIMSLCLMVLALGLRIRSAFVSKRIKSVLTQWRAVFTGAVAASPTNIRHDDVFTILSLWNDFNRVRTASAGVSAALLQEVAITYQFMGLALWLLGRDAGDKLVALATIGYIREVEALPQILALLDDRLGDISLAAYRALVLIHPLETDRLARAIAVREDWRSTSVEQLLQELGPDLISSAMVNAADDADDAQLIALLRYFPLCDPAICGETLRAILGRLEEPNVLAAALRAAAALADPRNGPLIRALLAHAAPFVRVAAIGALRPICGDDDRQILIEMLGDRDSWVRYRAAQTIVEFFTHEDHAGDVQRELADRFARDALNQVLAERSVLASQAASHATEETATERHGIERRPIDAMRAGPL